MDSDSAVDHTSGQCVAMRASFCGQSMHISPEFIKRFPCCFVGVSIAL